MQVKLRVVAVPHGEVIGSYVIVGHRKLTVFALAYPRVVAFSFVCSSCGLVHEGMPTFGAHAPLSWYEIPESERASRASLGTDDCVIGDGEFFVVKGSLEIPVHDEDDPFVWSVWVSLSESNFVEWISKFDEDHRSHVGPFFGWLNAWLKPYPETMNLKTMVHLRDHGVRPFIELEPTDHPLAIEQREGISRERVADLYTIMVHGSEPQNPE